MGDFRQLPGESPHVFCFHFITKCQCCQTCAHWFTTSESCNCLCQGECVLLSMHVLQSHLTSVFTLLVQQGNLTVVAVVTAYLVCLVDVGGVRERRREGVIGVGVPWWGQVGFGVRLGRWQRWAILALILPRRWSSTVAQGLSFSQLIAQLRHLLFFLKKTREDWTIRFSRHSHEFLIVNVLKQSSLTRTTVWRISNQIVWACRGLGCTCVPPE